jgi:hypothetical protein
LQSERNNHHLHQADEHATLFIGHSGYRSPLPLFVVVACIVVVQMSLDVSTNYQVFMQRAAIVNVDWIQLKHVILRTK